tara:strand:+ start:661 stop:816 length:156 start_codon:yes stop_codon:yes gene_type:complete
MMSEEYTKLESIHCALQELQNEYHISDDNEHLQIALKFTEDIREKYFEEEK